MWSATKVAIDLGTANSVVYVAGKGIVLQEPTVVALDNNRREVVAVGVAAIEILGKAPEHIEAIRPIRLGTIAHYRATEALLRRFLAVAAGRRLLFNRPEVFIAVPAGLTSVEERAVNRALLEAGAGSVRLIPEPIAAALGAELAIDTAQGSMIVNIGGGTAEIAILSNYGIVTSASHRGAGDMITQAIQLHFKKKFQIIIGEQMAEQVKMTIGAALAPFGDKEFAVRGSDARTGLPVHKIFRPADISDAIQEVVLDLVAAVSRVLEKTPPELMTDIIDRGAVLSGGTALLAGIDRLFSKAVGVPFHVADEPLLCVTRGLVSILENPEAYQFGVKELT